jgi:hypothetical protein
MTVRANQHIKTIDDSVRQSTDVVGNVVRVTTELNSLTQQLSVLVKRFTVDSNSVDTEKTEEISNENTDDNVDFF